MLFRVLAGHFPRAVQFQVLMGLGGTVLWGLFGTGRLAFAAALGALIGVVLGIYTTIQLAVLQRQEASPERGLWSLVKVEFVRFVLAIALLYLAIRLVPDAFLATLTMFASTLLVYPFAVKAESGVAE